MEREPIEPSVFSVDDDYIADASDEASDAEGVLEEASPTELSGWISHTDKSKLKVSLYISDRFQGDIAPRCVRILPDKRVVHNFNILIGESVRPGDTVKLCFAGTKDLLLGHNPYRVPDGTRQEADMDRDQIQDMIAALDARTDAKLERLVGEMRETAARQDARFETYAVRQDAKFDTLAERLSRMQMELVEGRREARSNRNIILVTVLPAILATGIAVAGLLLASQANLISSFSAGVAVRSAPVEKSETVKP